MKVYILGGDGYCGWVTSLYLSEIGHEVTIIDNLSRRTIDSDQEVNSFSVTPIMSIEERIATWEKITGKKINYHNIHLAYDLKNLLDLLKLNKPDIIINMANQSSKTYSMIACLYKHYTYSNNTMSLFNLLNMVVESGINTHIINYSALIGGIYSVYDIVENQSNDIFNFYNRNNNIKITDFKTGIVYGCNTNESEKDDRLINRLSYCSIYGTVVNRFVTQSQVNYPVTIYGNGKNKCNFININDLPKCFDNIIESSNRNEKTFKILKYVPETYDINTVANMVSEYTGCEIRYYKNPRYENRDNNSEVADNIENLAVDFTPTTMNKDIITGLVNTVEKYKHRVDTKKIMVKVLWNNNMVEDTVGSNKPID